MSDIISILKLDQRHISNVIVAKELNHCDSSFITSCVLGHCIKTGSSVFVICLHSTTPHYESVGMKMSYNLQKSINSGLIKFFNLDMMDVGLGLQTNCLVSPEKFITQAKRYLEAMKNKHLHVNIIFEGVSHLFDIGYSLKEIHFICKELVDITRKDKSFLLLNCNVANEGDETHVLANLLAHKSDVAVDINQLSSGWSIDVTGNINVVYPSRKFNSDYVYNLDPKPSHHLFKMFDRGVKLLVPGTLH
ncbi:uncharacterized protein LOC126966945 [Leptidea sinapis]|uniref:uncharacterized protein LOC126966945 n=1 Tax=Leptidea sinapis TaxID=189913 RepID=UPI0021433898|nr:uncharacterized protein LOC126966945 [Leptidea sinapis]XP_050667221.1 uncharacterized protein LOC126966945 [Leptidea sinapis]XP_050667222.1 uncharacterized protein LOC126966945 [Leptidea sinapis]XP_050667223.1 uncharacterized protein LOC126966945 [Leptidea sinapis]